MGRATRPLRKIVFKSSAHYYGCERDDPAFFTEAMQRPHPPRTRLESDIVEAENAVRGFAERNTDVSVTVLRFANGLGPDLETSHRDLLSLPAIPCILGFDPRYQFVHEDDIVSALEHAVANDVPGTFDVAGDGVLVLSEVAACSGARWRRSCRRGERAWPPPDCGSPACGSPTRWPSSCATGAARQPQAQGRGFPLRYTTREAISKFGEDLRVRELRQGGSAPYRYEREVEEFLRYSPSVRRKSEPTGGGSAS